MDTYISSFLREKKSDLSIYSPYRFLRDIDSVELCENTFIEPLLQEISQGSCFVKTVIENSKRHYFFYKYLKWDSEYFKKSIYKIELILFDHQNEKILKGAIKIFINEVINPCDYFFLNVPSEDTVLIQAISQTGFKLVETRLNYYMPGIKEYEGQHYNVRGADINDIIELKKIAIKMRNKYDRVHADPAFTSKEADFYLATFIEESIKGFADFVIIPDISGVKPFGFLAANKPKNILGYNVAKLVLAAVDNSIYKGWLFKLLSEVIFELKGNSTDFLTTITQASNGPAIRTWEKAGFRLGFVTHIYSYFD